MNRWKKDDSARRTGSLTVYAGSLKGGAAAAVAAPVPFSPKASWDPYWLWAELTQWRGFERLTPWNSKSGRSKVRVMLRAKKPGDLQLLASSRMIGIRIPQAYLQANTCFATGLVSRAKLARLASFPDVEFELGAPLKDQGSALAGDAKGLHGQQTTLDLPPAKSVFQRVKMVHDKWNGGSGTIAVFDYGCPFLRNEYASVTSSGANGSTRVQAIWHQQETKADGPWKKPSAMAYGRQLLRPALEGLRKRVFDAKRGMDETHAYRSLEYLVDYDDPRRRVFASTHGAHVLDVVGGTIDPLTPSAVQPPADDLAAQAGLIFVHMPESTAGDSSGASLGVYLLDALRYSVDMAEAKKPLVVNVSYGSTAGPHDGTSMIEQAMDEMLTRRDQFAIVLAAGNSRRFGLHTSRTAAPAKTALFRINVAAGDHTDTFVEFWYQTTHASRLKFRARLPDGDWSDWVAQDERVALRSQTGDEVIAALVHRTVVPNGGRPLTKGKPDLSMVLLALRPTAAPDDDDGELAPAGQWEVEASVTDQTGAAVTIDGWIKRDDSRPFGGRVQSAFLGLQADDADHTLSNLASGEHTIVAGAFRWSDGMPAGYSSVGPRGTSQWPLIYGMSEWDSTDPGIRASAVRSRETFLMNGTSVAAPVVARRVFNAMCKLPAPVTRPALQAELEHSAKQPGSFIRW